MLVQPGNGGLDIVHDEPGNLSVPGVPEKVAEAPRAVALERSDAATLRVSVGLRGCADPGADLFNHRILVVQSSMQLRVVLREQVKLVPHGPRPLPAGDR